MAQRTSLFSSTGGAAAQSYDGVRIGPPPDLPSLLLHNRIVYIGMPLVPSVTELILAQLLYLNYESSDKPIYMYINSSGTSLPDGRAVGFETEAFAIADCMRYIKPEVHTIALGQAFGTAAMLLGMGSKGNRFALPNACILLNQPRTQAQGQASDIAIKAREVVHNRKITCQLIAEACGKNPGTVEEVRAGRLVRRSERRQRSERWQRSNLSRLLKLNIKPPYTTLTPFPLPPSTNLRQDASRVKYLQPEEAVEYGLIDKVLNSEKDLPLDPSFMSSL